MRISDWSSDVCSSDLLAVALLAGPQFRQTPHADAPALRADRRHFSLHAWEPPGGGGEPGLARAGDLVGHASAQPAEEEGFVLCPRFGQLEIPGALAAVQRHPQGPPAFRAALRPAAAERPPGYGPSRPLQHKET